MDTTMNGMGGLGHTLQVDLPRDWADLALYQDSFFPGNIFIRRKTVIISENGGFQKRWSEPVWEFPGTRGKFMGWLVGIGIPVDGDCKIPPGWLPGWLEVPLVFRDMSH